MEKKLDGNYTRMLRVILNKSWKQHFTKQQLYGHLPLIMKTIQVRWIRHAGHYWRNKDELISDILLWTPSHGWAKARRQARIYIQQLCADNSREQWTIETGVERGSGRSVLAVRHDDDDEDYDFLQGLLRQSWYVIKQRKKITFLFFFSITC